MTPSPGQVSIPKSLFSVFIFFIFCLTSFEDIGLPFWVPGILCQHSEVILWKLLKIQMISPHLIPLPSWDHPPTPLSWDSLFQFVIHPVLHFISCTLCMELPGGTSGKEPSCQCRRHRKCRFNPWVRNIPWRRAWQPTPVFLSGESHGQRSLAGYSPYGCKELNFIEAT